jgi:hypothetical protein
MVVFGAAQCSKQVWKSVRSTDGRCSSDVKLKYRRWKTAGRNGRLGAHIRFYARCQPTTTTHATKRSSCASRPCGVVVDVGLGQKRTRHNVPTKTEGGLATECARTRQQSAHVQHARNDNDTMGVLCGCTGAPKQRVPNQQMRAM